VYTHLSARTAHLRVTSGVALWLRKKSASADRFVTRQPCQWCGFHGGSSESLEHLHTSDTDFSTFGENT
jgi:hypothetical protein